MIDGLAPMHDMIIVELEAKLKAHIALHERIQLQVANLKIQHDFWQKLANERSAEIIRLMRIIDAPRCKHGNTAHDGVTRCSCFLTPAPYTCDETCPCDKCVKKRIKLLHSI